MADDSTRSARLAAWDRCVALFREWSKRDGGAAQELARAEWRWLYATRLATPTDTAYGATKDRTTVPRCGCRPAG